MSRSSHVCRSMFVPFADTTVLHRTKDITSSIRQRWDGLGKLTDVGLEIRILVSEQPDEDTSVTLLQYNRLIKYCLLKAGVLARANQRHIKRSIISWDEAGKRQPGFEIMIAGKQIASTRPVHKSTQCILPIGIGVSPTVSDLWDAYLRLDSVWKVGDFFGIAGQTVHQRLRTAGYKLFRSKWTPTEDGKLLDIYAAAQGQSIDLVDVSRIMGRTTDACCQRAAELGLTELDRPASITESKRISGRQKSEREYVVHPNLGRRHGPHTPEAKAGISAGSINNWARWKATRTGPMSPKGVHARKMRMHKVAVTNRLRGGYSRCKGGRRADLADRFFRSSWEANIARYLNFLLKIRAIDSWEYEVDTFEFHKVRRGSRFYTPDFKIKFSRDDFFTYWEVKGWMDPASRTKLSRMKRYYPDVKLIVIGDREYRALAKDHKGLPNWE